MSKIEFIEYLRGYEHSPEVDEGCTFGDHWWCGNDDWVGYSFRDWVDHVYAAWEKEQSDHS